MGSTVTLSVPAEAVYARTVRMTAANLAVVLDLDVDTVEDLRIAAEEGFVFACATGPEAVDVLFELGEDEVGMSFTLGDADPEEADAELDLVELLLAAVCDDFCITDGVDGEVLVVRKNVTSHAA